VVFLLAFPRVLGLAEEPGGDDKIEDTIESIQEAQNDPAPPPSSSQDEEDDEELTLLEVLLRLFAEVFWEYAFSVRFADYPYALDSHYVYSTTAFLYPDETKVISAHAATELASHLDGTYGNVNRLAVELAAFHFNFFNQNIFAETRSITVLSLNGGFSLIVKGFVLNAFLGVYKLDFLDTAQLSFGLSGRVFLPAHLYLDLYNLNAVLNTVRFNHLLASLNWTSRRFAVGLGYDCTRLAEFTYAGPCLRLSFWL
jgi:hypothetical protein